MLKRVLAAVPDLWVENFVPAKEVHFAADHPFALMQLMPVPGQPFPVALARLHPDAAILAPLNDKIPAEQRARLNKSEDSITVKQQSLRTKDEGEAPARNLFDLDHRTPRCPISRPYPAPTYSLGSSLGVGGFRASH